MGVVPARRCTAVCSGHLFAEVSQSFNTSLRFGTTMAAFLPPEIPMRSARTISHGWGLYLPPWTTRGRRR